uniref:Uncharacterized protein n=1 Tax=Acanthochromis polyacanthus TaxID=80966 RepID=A0A3Q1GKS9_9TELE
MTLQPLCSDFTNILFSLSSTDEIMQLDSSPLRAADITPDLRKQFAFLSGGRGDNGSPIIVFPEFPAFGEITDREFHNVLTYLTSVPRICSDSVWLNLNNAYRQLSRAVFGNGVCGSVC